MINKILQFIQRQICQIQKGGLHTFHRKFLMAINRGVRLLNYLILRTFVSSLVIKVVGQLIDWWPTSALLYPPILFMIEHRPDSDPSTRARLFLKYFLPYLKVNDASILKYRLQAYNSYWLLQDQIGLQKMMQTFVDNQGKLVRQHQLTSLNILIANNIFFANGSTHGYLDTHLKAMMLGWDSSKKIVALIDENQLEFIANPTMFEYWKKYVDVISHPNGRRLMSKFKPYLQQDLTYMATLNGKATYIEYAKCIVQKEWEKQNRKPLLELSDEHIEWGSEMMLTLGLPKDAWFVSLHVRDSGYKTGSYKNTDPHDGYRNADIDTYYEAIDAIVKRGGYVVRVGDPLMKPHYPVQGLIDYAHSNIRSNRLDIYLFAHCRFFLGTSSGPILTPFLFGTPVVGTNYAPLSARLHSQSSLVIHKLVMDKKADRILSYQEAFEQGIAQGFTSINYKSSDISPIDNTPEEILEVTLEMLDSLDGMIKYSAQDEQLQKKVNLLYHERSGYGDIGRIGKHFLSKVSQYGLLN